MRAVDEGTAVLCIHKAKQKYTAGILSVAPVAVHVI